MSTWGKKLSKDSERQCIEMLLRRMHDRAVDTGSTAAAVNYEAALAAFRKWGQLAKTEGADEGECRDDCQDQESAKDVAGLRLATSPPDGRRTSLRRG